MNNGWAAGGGFTLLTWRLEVRAPPGRSLYDGVLEVPTGKRYLCACFCPRVLYIHTTLATWLSKAPDKFIPEIFFTTLISVSSTVAILLKKTWTRNLLG